MTASRKHRLLRVLELVSTRPVRTQDDLVALLTAEGFHVTQSSVSRDVAALGLVKRDGVYHRPPPEGGGGAALDPNELRIREGVLEAEAAGDVLVIVKTPPGEANRVGVALDRLAWGEVAGTIAGDDTIFVAARSPGAQHEVLKRLQRLTPRGAPAAR